MRFQICNKNDKSVREQFNGLEKKQTKTFRQSLKQNPRLLH